MEVAANAEGRAEGVKHVVFYSYFFEYVHSQYSQYPLMVFHSLAVF